MNQRLFATACILVCGLLVKFGAPPLAVALGMALAALWHFKGAPRFRKSPR